jgi:hypothetical protein
MTGMIIETILIFAVVRTNSGGIYMQTIPINMRRTAQHIMAAAP